MRAAIYGRISDDREELREGVERQVADCRDGCERRGWFIDEDRIYVDNDLSAYKANVERPEYKRMLEDIAAGLVDCVMVYHQDRLWRQPRDLEDFIDVCRRAGVNTFGSVTGDTDLSTGDGLMKLRILASVAANQSDATSRRVARKHVQLASQGKVSGGGPRAFGYERDGVTIVEAEAEIIREMAGRFLAGESIHALAKELTARGVKTTMGNGWARAPLKQVLKAARYSGQREHKGKIMCDAIWPPILTKEQTDSIRAKLAVQTAGMSPRGPQVSLLLGILRCGVCGTPLKSMRTSKRAGNKRGYMCPAEPGRPGSACVSGIGERIEEFVVEAMLSAVDAPEMASRFFGRRGNEDVDALALEIRELSAELAELEEAKTKREITLREFIIFKGPIQDQLDRTKRKHARNSPNAVVAEFLGSGNELRKRWPDLSFDRQHAILKSVFAEIVMNRAASPGSSRFDPERFELIWRY